MWRTTKSKIDDLEERVTKLEKPQKDAEAAVRDAIRRVALRDDLGKYVAKSILDLHGACNVRDLSPASYDAVIKACNETLKGKDLPKSGRFPALVTNFHEAAFDAASRLVRIGARGKIYRYDDAPRPIFWHWRQIGINKWQRFDVVTKRDFGPVRRCDDKTPDGHPIVRRNPNWHPYPGAQATFFSHKWQPQIGADYVWADEFVTFDSKTAAARLENLMKSVPPWAKTVKLEKRTMTPFTLSVLVHTYYSPEPFHNRNCEAYRRAIRDLISNQLIEPRHGLGGAHETDSYCATARGNVLVEAMVALPLPVQAEPKWVVPGRQS